MKDKIVTPEAAVSLIHDGDTLCLSGFIGTGTPEELIVALEKCFLATGHPRDLTLVFAAAPGDGASLGINRLAHRGLIKRVIGGHLSLVPKIVDMIVANEIEAYNLPMGTLTQLFREIGGKRAGLLTKVGLGTFVDPRNQGGKLNSKTTEDIVRVMEIDGEEWLFYKAFPIDVAFVRGTTADARGNISMEKEALTLDNLAIATATTNSDGLVIAQVERLAQVGSLNPRLVKLPRVLVDCVVVAHPEYHWQTYDTQYSAAFSGEVRVNAETNESMVLDERKIIARRCAYELPMGGVVNLGIGLPEGVSAVANEERIIEYITLTCEPGVIGGMPQAGMDFGAGINSDAILDQNQQFDFYDGGGLDLAILGLAQADQQGNVNVSRFGHRIAGAGGFINISQNARKLVFAGTFTAGGLKVELANGKLNILQEGKFHKFHQAVEHITFNGSYAAAKGQPVLYVTERCVLELTEQGLKLIEVAPGISIERDILPYMDFEPIIDSPKLMKTAIFQDIPMQLGTELLDLEMADRLSFDDSRNILFFNLAGYQVRRSEDIDRIERIILDHFHRVGRKFALVANYDGFYIDMLKMDSYAQMISKLEERCYTSSTRYSTSAFLRMKLGRALSVRKVSPRLFETDKVAEQAFPQALD